jgi:glycosyltransferase involved in cell wall biosynthesis
MRVLFVFILPSGGVHTLNKYRVRALRHIGIESHVLYFQTGSGTADTPPDIPVFYADHPAAIGHLLQVYAYHAIVVTSFFLQLEMFRRAGFTGPIIFENQGFGPPEEVKPMMFAAQPYVNAYADALLYPLTEHIGEAFREAFPGKPIFAFPNLFDADSFGYIPSDNNPDRPVLAWIGRLENNKNWRDFLRIGAETAKSVPNLHLWMFTDPSLASPGEAEQFALLTRQLGLTERMTHYSNIPNDRMPDYLSRVGDSGGLLIMTSKGEGGGAYAAVEAISCSCPVVTTDSDGVRAVIIDGKTGLYYPHGDIAAGSRQVQRLITQHPLREMLLRQGNVLIRTKLSPGGYARSFAEMLQALGVIG